MKVWTSTVLLKGDENIDFQVILDAITTQGFSIVMCLILLFYIKDTSEKNNVRIDNLNAQHREEMNMIAQAINNNTVALTRLSERIENGN